MKPGLGPAVQLTPKSGNQPKANAPQPVVSDEAVRALLEALAVAEAGGSENQAVSLADDAPSGHSAESSESAEGSVTESYEPTVDVPTDRIDIETDPPPRVMGEEWRLVNPAPFEEANRQGQSRADEHMPWRSTLAASPMRTVLVCVRTQVAAQTVAAAAARLGVAHAVRTAVTTVEALARLSEQPADLVLADPSLSRPDSAEFSRRVLAVAPGATILFFGTEEPRAAAAAIAAGARAVIRVDASDPVTTLAKAVMLVLSQTGRPAEDATLQGRAHLSAHTAASGGLGIAGQGRVLPGGRVAPVAAGGPASRMVPAGAPGATGVPQQRGDLAGGAPRGRVELTERELQVLRLMVDGRSNAEIGRELFVSEDTVKTYARRLFRKLGARDRAHAVAMAFRSGLVS
jgi:DNA-binding NarL/FixJ family response regulator